MTQINQTAQTNAVHETSASVEAPVRQQSGNYHSGNGAESKSFNEAEVNRDPFGTFGTPEVCTWSVGPGTCRFQTDQPCIARKLSQRSGAGLVAWSVQVGYLLIFQETISPRSARKLVTRYLKAHRSLKESEVERNGD